VTETNATDRLLIEAFGRNDSEGIAKAIRAGADVNVTVDGFSLLHLAAMQTRPDLANQLIAAGADANAVDSMYERTALMFAATMGQGEGHIPLLQKLLAAGADMNAEDINGRRAIDLAATMMNTNSMKLLIEHGAETKEPGTRREIRRLAGGAERSP
jgi:ankyrin repeat protein